MTSRTPMGAQSRQPQRAASSSTLGAQRSSHQRSLSQQYHPSSPIRKDAAGADATSSTGDPSTARHVATPRRGGSRLRLELSNEYELGAGSLPGSAIDIPQSLTPSRMLSMSDSMDTGNGSPALSKSSQHDIDNPPIPMPKRRPPTANIIQPVRSVSQPTVTPKKDARPKPYVIEIPSAAPRYASTNRPPAANRDTFSKGHASGCADFFPWGGNHHEDVWSAEAIQKGTWEKGNQTETGSAKLSVFPALKQKTGLSALSSVYHRVLTQRRHRGQITAPSTFKPPPRVTLTDTKREVWLKDLANPTISLRRLSRTIPHGIRGRTLLDQCLNKNVPTERAVWLAKCVGANEIRAFKRKGVNGAFAMGGELKWIRDWTVFVEQFVDAIVSTFEEPEWKAKVTYAIRLATNLYSEHLLDRDHYLDWITSGLENSTQSRLPMWILIAQICWTDLLRARKYGRRLVYSLLVHLHTIRTDPDQDILIQLSSQLNRLLQSLVSNNPESFINPSAWLKYRDTLQASLPEDDDVAKNSWNKINARNSRLLVTNTSSPAAGRQHLVNLLDSTLKLPSDPELSAKCWSTGDDKNELLKTVVEWATSIHRPGLAKVYLAAGLIRQWSTFRVNTTSAILRVLDDIAPADATRKRLVYHLVTELVRSGHFSVPQYHQWLMARGGYRNASDIDSDDGPCATRLLIELPLHCLSQEQKLQRENLLRRAGSFSVAEEASNLSNAIKCVDDTLGLSTDSDKDTTTRHRMSLRKLVRKISCSDRALQSCVGAHLRDVFTNSIDEKADLVPHPGLLASVRALLEAAEDFAMLSDVLSTFARVSDINVLASCADTVDSHLQIFLALGSADDLFDTLVDRLKSINQDQGIIARPLLASLCYLARRLPSREVIARLLQQELAQSDRNNAIDACSPVSDNMAGQAQSLEGEVSEQIEKLLSSGSSVDHPTMNRLFRNILPRLEAGWTKMDESLGIFVSLLSRLRVFDTRHFDRLMGDWASHVRSMKNRPPLLDLFPLMVTHGCLSISTLLRTANTTPSATDATSWDLSSNKSGSATYLQELLRLVVMKLPPSVGLTADEIYRFHVQQQSGQIEHSAAMVLLIRNAIIECSYLQNHQDAAGIPLREPSFFRVVLDTLRLLVVIDSAAVAECFNVANLPQGSLKFFHQIVTDLLSPGHEDAPQVSFEKILNLANELTMPFCQLKLNFDLLVGDQNLTGSGEQTPSRFDVFAKAIDQAIETRNIMWTTMIPCLSEDITQHLNSQAHSRFLDLIPSTKSPSFTTDYVNEQDIQLAENLLGVIEAIIPGQPASKATQLTSSVVDKLSDLWDIATIKEEDRTRSHGAVIQHWLPALLRFIIIHSASSESQQHTPALGSATGRPPFLPNNEAKARIVLILCGLLLDLEALSPQRNGALAQQVFDTAIILADSLPDDLRAACAKTILLLPGGIPSINTTSDARIYYLFSTPPLTAADNLKIAQRDKSTIPTSAMARGMGALFGFAPQERHRPFVLRRWEVLSEPTPNVGENDTSLSLGLFEAIKIQ